jgi:hypothetical protein
LALKERLRVGVDGPEVDALEAGAQHPGGEEKKRQVVGASHHSVKRIERRGVARVEQTD